jgi:hypothetical protein
MIIGDVLGTTFIVLAVCVSVWALLVGVALVYNEPAGDARTRLEAGARQALAVGFLMALAGGGLGLLLANLPNGLIKLIGWALLLGLLALAALGGGGMALLVGAKIEARAPRLSSFGALGRGAGLLVAVGLVPLLGWFVITPLSLLTALGAGTLVCHARWKAARRRPRPSQPAFVGPSVPGAATGGGQSLVP